jgi:hypothetical protein
MIKALSKYHLVAVTWDDAHHSLDEQTAETIRLNIHKAARTTNYGLKVQDDDAGITLTSEEDTDGDLRHVFFIPRKMIVEVHDFGLPKRKQVRQKKNSVTALTSSVSI